MLATTNYDLDEIQVNQMIFRPLATSYLLVFGPLPRCPVSSKV